jgi:diaminopimelate epimerase
MRVRFTKVEGLGNDFLLVDGRASPPPLDAAKAASLCDRHFGVGADGVLVLRAAPDADALLEIWNADGSRSEMCGNGLRCAAQSLFRSLGRETVSVRTEAGLHRCDAVPGGQVSVELVGLRIEAAETIAIEGRAVTGRVVSLGNPHFVTRGLALDQAPTLGPLLEHHARFAPARTNVEFCEVQGGGLRLRVWERGAGLTLACGTGAGAAAAAAWAEGLLPRQPTRVSLPGGEVLIKPLSGDALGLVGPARTVFEGELTVAP